MIEAPQPAAITPGPGMLTGKRLLITGVMNRRSIAFAAAEAAMSAGAEVVLTSFGRVRGITERAARRLPVPVDVLELDVNKEADLEQLARELDCRWGRVDGVLHAIANGPPDAFGGNFLATPRESAEQTFSTSAYSLKALAAALLPLMERSSGGASIVGLDFDASVVWPGYDWMGVAKAALESVSRYLARYLGEHGVRVNLISAGPLRTVSSSAIDAGFLELAERWGRRAPLGWDSGATDTVAGPICFLLSDFSRGITGELIHVDGGFHAIGVEAAEVTG